SALVAAHEAGEPFNPGWLEEPDEEVLVRARARAVSPLVETPGTLVLTQRRVYFQPAALSVHAPVRTVRLETVSGVERRRYRLEEVALELLLGSARESLYLVFDSERAREEVRAALARCPALRARPARALGEWTADWTAGRVSNFEYLMQLNKAAGRSFQDLTQYPVFPWVLRDYASPALDLDDPAVYRDLSKPVGALEPRRLATFRERFAELGKLNAALAGEEGRSGRKKEGKGGRRSRWKKDRDQDKEEDRETRTRASRRPSSPVPPPRAPALASKSAAATKAAQRAGAALMQPFMYGCHYSTPGYVAFYLMRADPRLMLRLQNGRYDAPDRLFWSVADTWKSVLALPSDVKELIPEFYSSDPSFLLAPPGRADFGSRADGSPVAEVLLPPWAKDARDFLRIMSAALESPHVSRRLHRWIDLVFGRASRGEAAAAADNVFHPLTYDEVARDVL
ncbi:Beige/BEACH domain-containing protein, partial [Helicosporidium sp. ATCC 50920]